MMGGVVGVESKPGHGSTFWFTALLGKPRQDEAWQLKNDKVSHPDLSGKHILLAEDNVFNQLVAVKLLEKSGCTVKLANNGLEVLFLLERERFDCVLMDMQMPEMDGVEATRRIRADSAFHDMPIIAMTANAMHEDRERCIAAGMNDYLTKPIQSALLYKTLFRWLCDPLPAPSNHEVKDSATQLADHLVDLNVLKELLGNDIPRAQQDILRLFIDSTRQDINHIESALLRGETSTAGFFGHKTKASAKSLGAYRFAELCESMEKAAQDNDVQQLQSLLAQVQAMLVLIEQEVEQKDAD
jgi:CheY-like chemotaxis protein